VDREPAPDNFLAQIIAADINKNPNLKIHTRFPPEPNGFLHLGHATSICLNFALAEKFNGYCNLRFDDTNPEKEEQAYADAIIEDVTWLGFKWYGDVKHTSDYFDKLYEWAIYLIEQGLAYVDLQDAETVKQNRGDFNNLGTESPYRNHSIDWHKQELENMRAGKYAENTASLRAKIDMKHANMNMRDPILYRIRKAHHHQTKDKWCIYPSYDFAHGQSDALEGITHSICTLEFQNHRPLYEWLLENLPVPSKPKQYEFARSNISYMITSKRKLKLLVDENIVSDWDDPRMPTISGMRRRGYTANGIKDFCNMLSVSRSEGSAEITMLESCVRNDLNNNYPRAMAVLNPILVKITNLPENNIISLVAPKHPDQQSMGNRDLTLTNEVYIDRNDFSTDSSLSRKQFKRLVLGDYVRLRNAFVIKADSIVKNEQDEIIAINASYVEDTIGKKPPEGIKPRGVIHWVDAKNCHNAEVRLYDTLFTCPNPEQQDDFTKAVNPNSLTIVNAKVEASLIDAKPEDRFQFEREGYFVADRYNHQPNNLVFNKIIGLKDSQKPK
jgi:glutaminyl-tRNA synthetase